MLLIVLEVQFCLLFSNKADFRVCFVARKSGRHCFSCRSLLLGTSVPNDICIYIYIYIYIHTHIYIYTHTYIYIYTLYH